MKPQKVFIPVETRIPESKNNINSGEVLRLLSCVGVVSNDKEKIEYREPSEFGWENTWAREKELFVFTEQELKELISDAFETGRSSHPKIRIVAQEKEDYLNSLINK